MSYRYLLKIKYRPEIVADEKALKSFKLGNGSPLPPSYVSFCKELGFGKLFDVFKVYVPIKNKKSKESLQFNQQRIKARFEEYLHPFLGTSKSGEEAELLRNAVPFAGSENGEYLYWDSSHPLDSGEFPVYYANFSRGISGTLAGYSMEELISSFTHPETVHKVLIFRPKALNPVFVALREKDLMKKPVNTVEQYLAMFKQSFVEMPFRSTLSFATGICKDAYQMHSPGFEARGCAEQGLVCQKALQFLQQILDNPELYQYGDVDYHKKQLYDAERVLSRRLKGPQEIDEQLNVVCGQLCETVDYLKTRDPLYLNGMLIRILYGLMGKTGSVDPDIYANHRLYKSGTKKLLSLIETI